jgi:hypothetical protein
MKLKKSEQDHIKALGKRWHEALAAASLCVRSDPHLVGLDKIREPLAYQAALCGTRCPDHPGGFVIPASAGPPHQGIQEIVDHCFAAAAEIARIKIGADA